MVDQETLNLCKRYIKLWLAAEGWDKSAYQYMQGPGGTRAVVTKAGWTKCYVTMAHCLLAMHPNLFALAAETYGTVELSYNFYDMKINFDRGHSPNIGKPKARKRGFEFSHTDINYWGARLLHKQNHTFDCFYQFVVPIEQGKSGLAVAAVSTLLFFFLFPIKPP